MAFLNRVVQGLNADNRETFNRICIANKIRLNYKRNKTALGILKEIFEERVYSDYFPFYKKAVIFDIGAHFGYFSLFANRNLHPDSIIYSFEPSSGNFEILKENLNVNNVLNVKTYQGGIGPQNERCRLILSNHANNFLEYFGEIKNSYYAEEIEVMTIEKAMFENRVEKIDFLKLDCEGSEYSILETMKPEVYRMIKTVSLEFHDLKSEKHNGDYIAELLQYHGFSLVKNTYSKTTTGLNYGKIVATRLNHPK